MKINSDGNLTIQDYSGASVNDFVNASVFVEVKNSHFELPEQFVANLTFKYHKCNYEGFEDKSELKK